MNSTGTVQEVVELEVNHTLLLAQAAAAREDRLRAERESNLIKERNFLLDRLNMHVDAWEKGAHGTKPIKDQLHKLRYQASKKALEEGKSPEDYVMSGLKNAKIQDAITMAEKPKATNLPDPKFRNLKKRLKNRLWRLTHLYYVINEDGKQVLFKLRKAQRQLLKNMSWRNLILKARQLGFTTFIAILALDMSLFNKNFRAGIIAHSLPDASTIFRDKVLFAYDRIPEVVKKRIRPLKRDSGELLLSNNSSIRVSTSFRSATCQFLHISEFGKICARYPHKAREIITGALPALHNGFLFIESTAEGREGKFFDMSQAAEQDQLAGKKLTKKDIKFHFFPWHENDSYCFNDEETEIYGELPERLNNYFQELEIKIGKQLSQGQRAWYASTEKILGDDMMREHPSTSEEAFQQTIEGAFFARQFKQAYAENRIKENVFVDPSLPVHTAWDLGFNDSTSIWFFQLDHKTGEIRIVDFYQSDHEIEGLEHYVNVLKARGYKYGKFLAPHDVKVHSWETGLTRVEYAYKKFGIKFEKVPGPQEIGLHDGIERVRELFKRFIFDEIKCDIGLKAAQSYRKEWDVKLGAWKKSPLHDWASHPADSLRYLAIAIGTVLTDKWQDAQEFLQENAPETVKSLEAHEESKTLSDMCAM